MLVSQGFQTWSDTRSVIFDILGVFFVFTFQGTMCLSTTAFHIMQCVRTERFLFSRAVR